MGILFAIVAWASWGVGDFLIGRSTRIFGVWLTLFYITAGAAIALLPWVWLDFHLLLQPQLLGLLLFSSGILLAAALFNFKAMKEGKLAVMEPIFAFEILMTILLSRVFLGETLNLLQSVFIMMLITGIFLVATQSFGSFKTFRLEAGVWYAIFGTICMGSLNFLFGVGARETSPLMINWFTSMVVALISLGYLWKTKRLPQIRFHLCRNKLLILSTTIIDNAAWVAFSFSVLYLPIAIATGITESYIALAAGLGIIVNKEKLKTHQWLGLVLAISSAILLAVVTKH